MNKYKLGQTLYWIKYTGGKPELMNFEVANIKQSVAIGYSYSDSKTGATYVRENILFESIEEAVNDGCELLKGFLNE